jgi:AraC-like DNA-binding protein
MLENPLLSLPPLVDEDSARKTSSLHYKPLPDDFVSALEEVMLTYTQEFDLSIEFVASLCNTSKRTLQRQLKEMGTHYSEVLAHARYRAACHMLQTPGLKVTDIAQRLHYSDLANFSRAFRRIAGVTPQAYRQQLRIVTN